MVKEGVQLSNMKNKYQRIAIVTDSLWTMGGANRVLDVISRNYPNADIYALFGNAKNLSQDIQKHRIQYSFLNRFLFIKKLYRYTFNLWPIAIESFDFSNYDLVISLSHSVAHGVVVPVHCKHVCYIHTPMRYAWDLNKVYSKKSTLSFKVFPSVTRTIVNFYLHFIRLWDVTAAQRSKILIANSNFVKDRIYKYWGKDNVFLIYPPVEKYTGEIVRKRHDYFVSGAPFEPNKNGEFLLDCASRIGFQLKVVGTGSLKKYLKRKFRKYKNIEFLGKISDKDKYTILSNAKGYIVPGIEDFGIFPVEAISCGTPVLAYKGGGLIETVEEDVNGLFFDSWEVENFKKVFESFGEKEWDYNKISLTAKKFNNEKDFIQKLESVIS